MPTLVLLALGLQSVRRQRDALEALTAHNERLSTERIGGAFESRIRDLAERAIRDDGFGRVLPLLSEPAGPANQRAIREAVAPIVDRHPVASRLVLLSGSSARFPVSAWPSPDTIDDLLGTAESGLASRFAASFREAERKEIDRRDSEGAAIAYRRCADLPVPARLKAIALARAARCYREAGQLRAAAAAWQEVAERHADDDDLFHRPYGLVGVLQLIELSGTAGERSRYVRSAVLQGDLARGRWEISAEQAEYFVQRVRPAAPRGPFLTQMQLAGVVERTIARPETLRAGELHQATVRLGDRDRRLSCTEGSERARPRRR